jgi:hypothetical protein
VNGARRHLASVPSSPADQHAGAHAGGAPDQHHDVAHPIEWPYGSTPLSNDAE